MAQNLIINGTIYNGVESISMTNEKNEKVTYIEKVITQPLPKVAKIGEVEYESVTEALASASQGDEVVLIDNTVDGDIVIPFGVTLDLKNYTLTANSLVGLSGSTLTGAADTNKNSTMDFGALLKVPKDKLFLQADNNNSYLPLWDPTTGDGAYRFSQIIVNTASSSGRGLKINADADSMTFQFKIQATADPYNVILKNYYASELAFKVFVWYEWTVTSDDGAIRIERYMEQITDTNIKLATGNYDTKQTLNGYSTLGINMDTLEVYAMMVTDSGAISYSDKWNANGVK